MSLFYLVAKRATIVYMDMHYFLFENISSSLLLANSKVRREWLICQNPYGRSSAASKEHEMIK